MWLSLPSYKRAGWSEGKTRIQTAWSLWVVPSADEFILYALSRAGCKQTGSHSSRPKGACCPDQTAHLLWGEHSEVMRTQQLRTWGGGGGRGGSGEESALEHRRNHLNNRTCDLRTGFWLLTENPFRTTNKKIQLIYWKLDECYNNSQESVWSGALPGSSPSGSRNTQEMSGVGKKKCTDSGCNARTHLFIF